MRALVDLSVMGLVFWGVWSLRFAGVENIGFWSILAGVGAGAALLAIRKESWRELGFRAGGDARFVLSRAGEFTILTLVTGAAVISPEVRCSTIAATVFTSSGELFWLPWWVTGM